MGRPRQSVMTMERATACRQEVATLSRSVLG